MPYSRENLTAGPAAGPSDFGNCKEHTGASVAPSADALLSLLLPPATSPFGGEIRFVVAEKAQLRDAAFDELHVVQRSLSWQRVDIDFQAFSQYLRHRFTVDIKNTARRGGRQGE